MKLRLLPTARLSFPLAAAIATLLAAPFASATPYYWDVNGTTAGFSTVVGAWNGTNAFWGPNASGTGGTYIAAPTTSDDLFINAATTNTGAITVTGTQNAGNITFGTTVGAVTLSGGTITMGAAATITANNWNATNVITSVLGGAGTSLTKAGNGGLTLQGANTYSGATILNGYGPTTVTSISGTAGSINTSSGITLNGTTLTLTNATTQGAVDRLNNSAASLITSNGGTLNYGNANTAGNTYAETAGTLTLSRGQLNVNLTTDMTNATAFQTLTFGGLTQAGTSAVQFSAAGTGPQLTGNKNMIVVSGAGTTAPNTIIGSYATVGTTSALQTDYAVYNANFVVGANIAGTGQASWTTAGQAFTQNTALETLGATRTVTALRNTGTTATTALGGNFLETYGLLNGVATTWTISGAGGVRQQGTAAANLNVSAGSGAIIISSQVTNNTGALTLVKNGASTLTLSNAANNYSGGTVINGGALNFVNGSLGTTGSITVNSVANIGSNQAGVARLQWGGTEDISARLNLVNNGYAMLDTNGNTVTLGTAFGSSSSSSLGKTGGGTLNLNGINTYTGSTDVYNGTVIVNAAQATTSIRVGHGTSNGGTAGATLRLGASNVLSSSVAVIVDGQSSNTFDLQTFNQTIGALSLGSFNGGASGTVTGSGSSTLTLTAGVTADNHNGGAGLISVPFLDLNGLTQNFSMVGGNAAGHSLTISSVIQNGGLNRTGGTTVGPLILSGANTFSGSTTISNGLLRLDNSLALQNSPLDTTNSVAGAANTGLRLNGAMTALTLGGLTGNKNFAAAGGVFDTTSGGYGTVATLTLNPGTGQTYSYAGVIVNGAAGMNLTKTGAGTQILTGSNTYSGATTITTGILQIGSGSTTGNLTATTSIVNNANLTINRSDSFTQASDLGVGVAISGSGSFTQAGAGTTTLTVNNTYNGITTISAGTLAMGSNRIANSPTIFIGNGATLLNTGAAGSSFFTLSANQNITGTGATGFATHQNVGANSYITTSGSTISNNASGTLTFSRLDVRGAGNQITAGDIQSGGAAASQRGLLLGNTASGDLTITGGSLTTNGGSTNFDMIGNSSAAGAPVATLTINGGSYVNTASSGKTSLGNGGGNAATGTLTLTSGSATINELAYNLGSFGGNTGTVNLDGGTLTASTITSTSGTNRIFNFNGGQFVAGSGSFTIGSGLTLNVKNGGAKIDTNGNSFTISDALLNAGTGGLIKSGSGTLTLTGTNTYTGATSVTAGNLVVNGSISTSILTTVATGATLGGSGTVGSLTIDSGGALNPGNSPGILTVDGDYSQAGTLNLEINGLTPGSQHDQVNVDRTSGNGTVSLSGNLNVIFGGGSYVANDLIFILLNDDSDSISGTFSGLAQNGFVINYGGFDWNISYTANNTGVGTGTFTGGNDIALTAVPEPRAALLGGLGLLALLRRRRA